MNFNECMEYISSFDRKGKRTADLSRASELMRIVGNPQERLEFIHIAGTNGKGSMAQMLSEIFTEGGYKTGLFTSPFLIEYSDRIRINGKNISQQRLCEIVEKIKPCVENSPLRNDFSQFEITQAIGFCYFAEEKCDVVVLETGLGGRLDSTNIIRKPLVTLIGSVALEHTAILGDTLEKIATQKAGIIKSGCPCVLSAGNDMRVVKVVREYAMDMQAQLCIPNLNLCRVSEMGIFGSKFSYKGVNYSISMQGLHQVSNALTVIDAMRFAVEKLPVSQEAILTGLERARLVGRCEVVGKDPLTILDGGHNPDGTRALSEVLKQVSKPIIAVIGMHSDKACEDAIKNLIPVVDKFIAVDGFSEIDTPKEELASIIAKNGGEVVCEGDISLAVQKAKELCKNGTAVICGSLYLVSYYHNNVGGEL